MIYGLFPPEFNSGRMYAGPGPDSMLAAATAWDVLASELQSTATSYESVIAGLTSGPWVGPSSLSMVAAVTPYLAWMRRTAVQAREAATQATAAVAAYEEAFAAHLPPAVIAANRAQLAMLVATNIFGQNTAAIAATEAQYGEMWAQDAVAMDTYLASSEAATRFTAFTEPPQTAGTSAGEVASTVNPAALAPGASQEALGRLAALAGAYEQLWTDSLNGLLGPNGSAWYAAVYNAVDVPLGLTTTFNDIGLLINLPLSQWLKFAPPIEYGALPKDALGAGLGALELGRGTLYSAVSPMAADMGRGTLVGALTVPPGWAANTPDVRMVASALTAAGPEAVPAAALGEGGLLGSISAAGMLGSAFGAGAPSVLGGTGIRNRLTPLKDLQGAASPEQLRRVVARISEQPESVQHHTVDNDGLDDLLQQLAKKPGVHAVHLKKSRSTVVPSDAQRG